MRSFQAIIGMLAGCAVCLVAQQSTSGRIDFNRGIRPILSDKCFVCHGPDVANNKSKLRLDTEAHAFADLGNGRRAIVRGDTEQSELIRRINAQNKAQVMPPVYSGLKLTSDEIGRLTDWVRQGAAWRQHWSFNPPVRPAEPGVTARAWPRNPIDFFVLARLEKAGLRPSPEAERSTLIRRLSFDLTGLPPDPKEIDGFIDDRSPDAYEKLVDRLLASPRYGERMAFRWLDAARYADTNGYQVDGEREMWRWRDWVIDAYNRNMPFDQFVVEQIAGDLLPNPSLDQQIATAFNRNHRGNSEDGLVPEEFAVEYVVDRVDTVSTVFLGLTMGCARCHNHKYDPFTQKEYYQLYAYFNNVPEDGRFSNFGNAAPWIPAPTREQQERLRQIDSGIANAERELASLLKATEPEQRRWEKSLIGLPVKHWFPSDALVLAQPFEPGAEQKIGFNGGAPSYTRSPLGKAAVFDGNIWFDAGDTANFDYRDRVHDFKDRFAISAWFYPESESSGAIVTRMSDEVTEQESNLPKGRGYGLFFENGKIHFNLVGVWADDSFRVETENRQPVREWHHVLAVFDSLEPYEKVRIYIDGRKQALRVKNGRLFRQFSNREAHLKIGGGPGPQWTFRGLLDEVRVYEALPDAEEIAVLASPEPLSRIASIPPATRTDPQRLKIRGAFLEQAASVKAKRVWQDIRELKQERRALEAAIATVMVMQELPIATPAYLLKRGAYDAPGERVERNVPAVLPAMDKNWPNNRLGLARWLVSPANPLTARVTVNRLWQMLFGTGLVKTSEDFGAQGELPSHPELLDWLAVEFLQNGQDVKALLKMMVSSATYRQSSKVSPELLRRDPENRLLARGSRLRLPAEMIRDQALKVAGLLVEKVGGPSVRPYQPQGLYKDMLFSNMTEYRQDKGEGLWRRSLYTFWKRTVMPPGMQVLDASSREYCTVREARTNTPLQALNLMNDTTYIEAARFVAERMMREGSTPEERVAFGFRAAAGRVPDGSEMRVLLVNLQAQLAHFTSQPAKAAQLLAVGEKPYDKQLSPEELAGYTVIASLILNLDEVITRQ